MKVNNHNNLPSWLDAFTASFGEKTAAEVKNISNLPSFSWENEVYYVNLTPSGAQIYNSNGIIVKEILDVYTVEDAEEAFCGGYVSDSKVAEVETDNVEKVEEESDKEITAEDDLLENVVAAMSNEAEEENQQQPEETAEAEVTAAPEDEEKIEPEGLPVLDESVIEEDSENSEVADSEVVEDETVEDEVKDNSDLESTVQDLQAVVEQLLERVTALESVEETVPDEVEEKEASVDEETTALSEQQYAREEIENDMFDLNSQDAEVEHFQEAAENTQKVIDMEHTLDISKQSGRCALNFEFLDKILSDEKVKQEIIDNIENQMTDAEQSDAEMPVEKEVQELKDEDVNSVINDRICPVCGNELNLDGNDDAEEISIECDKCNTQYTVDVNAGKIYCK